MRKLVSREFSLREDEARYSSQRLFCDFDFQSKAEIVDEMIKKTEFKLIFIDDYSDVQFRIKTKKEVREDLSSFLFST